MSARKKRASKRVAAAPESSLRDHPSFRTIPEIGTNANDVNLTMALMLTALGVNLRADDGTPTAATILSHGVMNELPALDLIISQLEDSSPEYFALEGVRERLELLAECAETMSAAFAASRHHTISAVKL